MMDRMVPRVLLALSCLGLFACERAPKLTAENEPPNVTPALVPPARPNEVISEPAKPEAAPPVLGDPLGLLSKKPEPRRDQRLDPSALDPGALREETPKANAVGAAERDPRAVLRGTVNDERVASTTVRDLSVGELRNAVLARPLPHVLLFYASYCPACRSAMPSFVDAVRAYRGPAGFTAVSIEDDRDALVSYVPALGGVIEPLWLAPPGANLRKASEEMGIVWPNKDSLSIPRIAVFDARGRVLRQGGYNEVKRLATTLSEL